MENHSYDNYLGMLTGRGEGFPLDGDGQPAVTNLDAEGSPVRAHHLATTQQAEGVPCQSWHASQVQWNQGKMDGFVTSTQEVTPDADKAVGMGYWSQDDLPFYYGLARTFPLADHWFSSCLGPTFPNRRFLIAGTANGLVDDLPFHLLDYPRERDHLRHADQARHLVGELPPGGRGQVQGAAAGPLPAPPGPPDADRAWARAWARSPMACRRTSSSRPTCSRSASASTCCTSTAWTSSSPTPTPARCRRSAWWIRRSTSSPRRTRRTSGRGRASPPR